MNKPQMWPISVVITVSKAIILLSTASMPTQNYSMLCSHILGQWLPSS
jgi:hypothetical protein